MTQQIQHLSRNPAENYERHFVPAIAAPLAHELVEVARLRRGERVLDVACGTGIVARLAAEQVGSDGYVAGVDVNPGMLDVARSATLEAEIEWREGNAEVLPVADRSVDVVLCQMGLQFVEQKAAALREMHRVLIPGGRVLVNVPGPTPVPFVILEQALARHLGPEAAAFVRVVFSLHDPAELRNLIESAGFDDVVARSTATNLPLPPAADFLWQYVYSTPLAGLAGQLDDDRRAALEEEVVAGWEPFVDNGGIRLDVGVTVATADA